jgi:hypothetical protein
MAMEGEATALRIVYGIYVIRLMRSGRIYRGGRWPSGSVMWSLIE